MKKNYNIQELAGIVHGELIHQNSSDDQVAFLLMDSRLASKGNNTLFIAIPGERHNGHDFIDVVYKKGCRNFLVSNRIVLDDYPSANFIIVDDTIKALQGIAKHHRDQFEIPVISITGSNGKTIVKEWLYQLLMDDFLICKSPKSYNSQVGVPLSLWELNDLHELGIFEAGISDPGEMQALESMLQPTWGIFTNIGDAHSKNFISDEQKIKEKLKLFTRCPKLILCKDHNQIFQLAQEELPQTDFITWSVSQEAEVQVLSRFKKEVRTSFKGEILTFNIPFEDEASFENVMNCITFLLSFDLEHEVIAKRVAQLSSVPMRMEINEGVNDSLIIMDGYSNDLSGLNVSLNFLESQNQYERKTLILGDSSDSDSLKYSDEAIQQLLLTKNLQRVIHVGKKWAWENREIEILEFESPSDLLRKLPQLSFQQEAILIKGSRSYPLKPIQKSLLSKTHSTVFEINLSRIVHNLNVFRNRLQPNTKIMGMVKAFSYGSGGYEIARLLEYQRVDCLGVAYVDEGIELRKKGIKLPIMVMNPNVSSVGQMIHYQLEPEIYNLSLLKEFIQQLKYREIENYPIHLKVETGMNRLGFTEASVQPVVQLIKTNKEIKLTSVFSHLSASDNPLGDEYTYQQFDRFEKLVDVIANQITYSFDRHILNSSGVLRFPDQHFEMIRLGIGLYGIGNYEHSLIPVGVLKTVVSQVKEVKAGEMIGYGVDNRITEPKTIAILPIGYADGFSRKLGNGNYQVQIGDYLAPTIGNICMDMTMIDVTNIQCKAGDEVIVFGVKNTLVDYANALNTIPYEALTCISPRVKRVYIEE